MPRSWTSSPDIHLDIDVAKPGRRRALEAALRTSVVDGRLRAGAVLPSSRALAHDLGLARGTVVEAYAQLVAEGYLVTRPGSATVVADIAPRPARSVAETAPELSHPLDLRPGLLNMDQSLPRRDWARAMRQVFALAPSTAFGYGDPRGSIELRVALADYLSRVRGVCACPDDIVICSGFGNGLSLVARALRSLGATKVAMEDPCLPVHRCLVRAAGCTVVRLPVDEHGAEIARLRSTAAAAVVTPAHQYPTGVTLRADRRSALLHWARMNGTVLVEDDYDGEFRYDRQPVGALQGMDPDHVVYVGTVSKTMAPGLRLGWVVLPPRLRPAVLDVHRHSGASPPVVNQLAFARLIEDGALDRHLRRLRSLYRRRRDYLVAALTEALPGLRPTGIAAGVHVVVSFPPHGYPTEQELEAEAAARGIALGYLSQHYHRRRQAPQGIVVGYARQPDTAFPDAVRTLVSLLNERMANA